MNRKIFIYSVVASIVATIFFSYCLQPASIWVWHISTSTSNYIFTSVQNSAVSNAAIGKRDWIDPMFMWVFACVVWAIATSYITRPIIKRLSATRLFSKQSDKKKGQSRLTHVRNIFKRLYFASAIPIFVVAICWTQLTFAAYVDLQLNASFSQRLDALGPYIDDQTQKQLRSEWARMETLDDYRHLTTEMDQLGQKAGIKLPTVLYR
jgi:hypothetical protein